MEIFQKLNIKPSQALKAFGIGFVVIAALAFLFKFTGSSFRSLLPKNGFSVSSQPGFVAYDGDMALRESAAYEYGDTIGLSVRNIAPSSPYPQDPGYTPGIDSEDFEVTSYNADIETRNSKKTCKTISDLKSREDVIFENSNEYDKGCDYTFKVPKGASEEILNILKGLDPKNLSENTYTIKKIVEDFTSQTEILEQKLASINATLDSAIAAYDNITDLATKIQDTESLAKIIDSKITIIERLTQQRIETTSQLERLSRAKAEQLDRLDFTNFYVSVRENKFIDGEDIKDSWKYAVKDFINNINITLQEVTIGIISLLFMLMQYIIYLLIILVVSKYGWRFTKKFWKK